jgi:cysteine sulfinate desulfinase/cysteine desulfurase-like protein
VLEAIGSNAGNALRMTIGRFNTAAEVDYAIDYLCGKIEACRRGRATA